LGLWGFGLPFFRFVLSPAGLELLLFGLELCLARGERSFSDRHLLRLRAEGLLECGRIALDPLALGMQFRLLGRHGLPHALRFTADACGFRLVTVFELREFELVGFELFRGRLEVGTFLLKSLVALPVRLLRPRDAGLSFL